MRRRLSRVLRPITRRVGDVLCRLMNPTLPLPRALAYRILSKYGEAKLVQQLWLHYVQTTAALSIHQSEYSLMTSDQIDGMLLFLLARGGFTNRVSVDIGAGDGINGNTANLILFHGFRGFMIDGSPESLDIGRQAHAAIGRGLPPTFIHALVTSGNINGLLQQHGAPERVDVLSIDIDSVDLYIAKAIAIVARIIVVEFNNLWGPDESMSVPNVDGFERDLGEFLYGGASLAAFNKTLTAKGYKLVGIAASGFDAFFVQDSEEFRDVPAIDIHALYERSPEWQKRHVSSANHPIRSRNWVRI